MKIAPLGAFSARIENVGVIETMKIAIVGLGYVGLPLCLQFARNDVEVVGLDIDGAKVTSINAGKSYIEHIDGNAIRDAVQSVG